MSIEYYVLDTETTGLKVEYHEINQISVRRVSDGKHISVDIAVENPSRANYQALQIQGKTKEDLSIGMSLSEAVEIIDGFFASDNKTKAHRCIVAHKASFDKKFCWAAWDSVKKEFPADLWLCSIEFAKRYVKKYGGEKIALAQNNQKVKYGLNTFMEGIGLQPKSGAHSASVDTENTVELFNWLMNSKTEHVSLIKRDPHKVPEV
jgi:DNA polymerase III epsilon subunit-like protein